MMKSPGDAFIEKCLEQVIIPSSCSLTCSHPHDALPVLQSSTFNSLPDAAVNKESVSSSLLQKLTTSPTSLSISSSSPSLIDCTSSLSSIFYPQLSFPSPPVIHSILADVSTRHLVLLTPSTIVNDSYSLGAETLISWSNNLWPSQWSSSSMSEPSNILKGWSEDYLRKVLMILRKDNPESSIFSNRFFEFLLVHHQLAQCGFYYTPRSTNEKVELKMSGEGFLPGLFLLRDSLDANCFFTMSFKTSNGVIKSTRIIYEKGEYSFNCSIKHTKNVKRFTTPLHLLQYYKTHKSNSYRNKCEWSLSGDSIAIGRNHSSSSSRNFVREAKGSDSEVDSNCKEDSKSTPARDKTRTPPFVCCTRIQSKSRDDVVLLRKPLKMQPESLKGSTRLIINRLLEGRGIERLQLSPSLKKFLRQYVFTF